MLEIYLTFTWHSPISGSSFDVSGFRFDPELDNKVVGWRLVSVEIEPELDNLSSRLRLINFQVQQQLSKQQQQTLIIYCSTQTICLTTTRSRLPPAQGWSLGPSVPFVLWLGWRLYVQRGQDADATVHNAWIRPCLKHLHAAIPCQCQSIF